MEQCKIGVIIRNTCQTCGNKTSKFPIDPPCSLAVFEHALASQRDYLAHVHQGHVYTLETELACINSEEYKTVCRIDGKPHLQQQK